MDNVVTRQLCYQMLGICALNRIHVTVQRCPMDIVCVSDAVLDLLIL